jgi:enamine deaminase RidA (YjgF/YER057c/UK114 family)
VEQKVINPWTWQDSYGFVQANEITGVNQILICSGQGSIDDEGNVLHAGDMRAQVNKTIDNLETVLSKAGYSIANVVRLNIYTTDMDLFFESYDVIVTRVTGAGARFASTLIGVTRLAIPEMMVEIDATAVK